MSTKFSEPSVTTGLPWQGHHTRQCNPMIVRLFIHLRTPPQGILARIVETQLTK
jgi:hypothetical protein